MKKLLIFAALMAVSTLSFGQRLQEGERQVNAGLGFNSGGWNIPIYASVDYGIYPDISVGGILSYSSRDYEYENHKNKGSWLSIGAKADYHFNTLLEIPNEWDLYAGLTLAYNYFKYDNDWHNDYKGYDKSKLGLSVQIGGRYYFDERWAVNLEFGGNNIASGGKIGVTYKF